MPAASPRFFWLVVRAVFGLILITAGSLIPLAAQAGFSLETAEAQLRPDFPQIERVTEALPAGVVARENIRYSSPGGIALELDVYRPEAAGSLPAVVIVHGGGWETGSRQMERPLAKHLAARGYVTVPISYRLGPAGRFPAALHDVKTAVRWLRAHHEEFGVASGYIGGSAGGQLVALAGASNGVAALEGDGDCREQSSIVQAVVDIDGLADFTEAEFVAAQAARPSAPTRFLGGSFAERAEVWRRASALNHVGARSAPTLFLNSTSPSPALPGRAAMRDRLFALGIDSVVVVVPDTPHPFWLFHPWFERVVEESDRFLARHLSRNDAVQTALPRGRAQGGEGNCGCFLEVGG
jgi:acetyl esterase/lipase